MQSKKNACRKSIKQKSCELPQSFKMWAKFLKLKSCELQKPNTSKLKTSTDHFCSAHLTWGCLIWQRRCSAHWPGNLELTKWPGLDRALCFWFDSDVGIIEVLVGLTPGLTLSGFFAGVASGLIQSHVTCVVWLVAEQATIPIAALVFGCEPAGLAVVRVCL